MTSEICLMNRLAVVLAADSATTVTQSTDEGQQERYFKGANKIFQLSNSQPVGIMIFDSADILNVPWEVVIKCFRRELGNKSFNTLAGYAQEFFRFLSTNVNLFPEQVQREQLAFATRRVALRTLVLGKEEEDLPEPERTAAVEREMSALRTQVSEGNFPPEISNDFADECIVKLQDAVRSDLEQFREHLPWMPADLAEMIGLAVRLVLQNLDAHLGATGLVFAGYGDHAVFPEMIEYTSSGLVVGSHIAREVGRAEVDHSRPAFMRAFAQTSMSDTFTLGLSGDVFGSVMAAVNKNLRSMAEEVCSGLGRELGDVGDFEAILEKTKKAISKSVLDEAQNEHATPMRRVLGVLPVDEMAELAETLINLQSLKEKVTRPSETVGGPVDVAVITLNEGLVWIKRKHYFDPSLNPRFFQRQATS